MPYSEGIEVERPEPVGDYKVPDGRYLAGMTGRLVELFTDGVPTVCMSLYLSPHTIAVSDALRVARTTGLPVPVTTIAEAVGSDVTNVVRSCVADGPVRGRGPGALGVPGQRRAGGGVGLHPAAGHQLGRRDRRPARHELRRPVPGAGGDLLPGHQHRGLPRPGPAETASVHAAPRGWTRDGYVLFLSRLAHAKGVDDLIAGFAASEACGGPDPGDRRQRAAGRLPARGRGRLAGRRPDRLLDDVDDDEKPHLMAGCAAFVLPSKPRPEFVETFGIALVEKMLAGGGPVITTDTGGIGEAVGDTALIVPVDSPSARSPRPSTWP